MQSQEVQRVRETQKTLLRYRNSAAIKHTKHDCMQALNKTVESIVSKLVSSIWCKTVRRQSFQTCKTDVKESAHKLANTQMCRLSIQYVCFYPQGASCLHRKHRLETPRREITKKKRKKKGRTWHQSTELRLIMSEKTKERGLARRSNHRGDEKTKRNSREHERWGDRET